MKCPVLINTNQISKETSIEKGKQTILTEKQFFGECIGEQCMAWHEGTCALYDTV